MKEWELGNDGFVMEYMIAGPQADPFEAEERAENQLELEARLRACVVTPKSLKMSPKLEKGLKTAVHGLCGYRGNNCFIDVSEFYSTLQRITLTAAVCLNAKEEGPVRARIWTYMFIAMGSWQERCNGQVNISPFSIRMWYFT